MPPIRRSKTKHEETTIRETHKCPLLERHFQRPFTLVVDAFQGINKESLHLLRRHGANTAEVILDCWRTVYVTHQGDACSMNGVAINILKGY